MNYPRLLLRSFRMTLLLDITLVAALSMAASPPEQGPGAPAEESVAERAKAAWESGSTSRALDLLDQSLHDNPDALALHKLRGDLLATARQTQEAIESYEAVLAKQPSSLDVRWAKWSVLLRTGKADEAIAELQHITHGDSRNPLAHLRLAHELRKLDRLEESLEAYKRAVELMPDALSWRLGLARARFDLLDYPGAERDVQYVLERVPPGSPLEIPAQNLLTVIYTSQDRGRRFEPVGTGAVGETQLKEWAAIRADAWRLFAAGRFDEAEPIYRQVLSFNPKDSTAAHQLGITLMQLGRCKDALDMFRKVGELDPRDEEYADTVFRMGQCLTQLERWEDAYVHFRFLYDTAVEFEEANKGVQLPPDIRVLDKQKLAGWLEKVRPHVPADLIAADHPEQSAPKAEDDLTAKIAVERLKPQKALDTRASLMGRDSDFSWFRYVITAAKVMRDDSPTGAHEYIPLNPGDSFSTAQQEIYLVFGLVTASYDEVPLAARCFLETAETTGAPRAVAHDQVIMSMNDQSGYFLLSRPTSGWTPGLYRCGLYTGERTSAYNHVDEVRFRIVEPPRAS